MLRVVLLGWLVGCHGPSDGSDDTGWCAEAAERTFWQDVDGDGFGQGANTTQCEAPAGFVDNDRDCDDVNPDVFPGAPELCNDTIDNDCDGEVDEEDTPLCGGREVCNAGACEDSGATGEEMRAGCACDTGAPSGASLLFAVGVLALVMRRRR